MAEQDVGIRVSANTSPAQDSIRELEQSINGLQDLQSKGTGQGFLSDDDIDHFRTLSQQATEIYQNFYRNYEQIINNLNDKRNQLRQQVTQSSNQTEIDDLRQRINNIDLQRVTYSSQRTMTENLNNQRGTITYGTQPYMNGTFTEQHPNPAFQSQLNREGTPSPSAFGTGRGRSSNNSGNGSGNGGNRSGNNENGGSSYYPLFGGSSISRLAMSLFGPISFATGVHSGMQMINSQESEMAQVGTRVGGFGNRFDLGRVEASRIGIPNGYTSAQTIALANQYSSIAGASSPTQLWRSVQQIQLQSRQLGLNPTQLAQSEGQLHQFGALGNTADQQQFADMIAGAVKQDNMQGRQGEFIQATTGLAAQAANGQANFTNGQVQNVIGLQATIGQGGSMLRGQNGARVIGNMNSAIQSNNPNMQIMLGMGTRYQGVHGLLQEQRMAAQGVSNPENLRRVFRYVQHNFSGTDTQEEVVMRTLNLTAPQADAIFRNPKIRNEIENGHMSKGEIQYLLKTGESQNQQNDQNYNSSNAGQRARNEGFWSQTLQGFAAPFDWVGRTVQSGFNMMPPWMRSIATGVLTAAGGMAFKGLGRGITNIGRGMFSQLFGRNTRSAGRGGFFSSIFNRFRGGGGSGSGTASAAGHAAENVGNATRNPWTYRMGQRLGGMFQNMYHGTVGDNVRSLYNTIRHANPQSIRSGLNRSFRQIRSDFGHIKNWGGMAPGGSDGSFMQGARRVLSSRSLHDAVSSIGKNAARMGSRVPIIGSALDTVTNHFFGHQSWGQSTTRGISSGLGGWAGMAAGGSAGAEVGSIFGPAGSAIGGIVGGIGGGIFGGSIGDKIGKNLYKNIFHPIGRAFGGLGHTISGWWNGLFSRQQSQQQRRSHRLGRSGFDGESRRSQGVSNWSHINNRGYNPSGATPIRSSKKQSPWWDIFDLTGHHSSNSRQGLAFAGNNRLDLNERERHLETLRRENLSTRERLDNHEEHNLQQQGQNFQKKNQGGQNSASRYFGGQNSSSGGMNWLGQMFHGIGSFFSKIFNGIGQFFGGGSQSSSDHMTNGVSRSAAAWSSSIKKAAKAEGVHLTSSQLHTVEQRIAKESNGNQYITNHWDSNAKAGHPSTGLLQYIKPTFSKYAAKGHNNIHSGYDQLLALFNDKNWLKDISVSGGWGPSGGTRGYANGTDYAMGGQAVISEGDSPEVVSDPYGRTVLSTKATSFSDFMAGSSVTPLKNLSQVNGVNWQQTSMLMRAISQMARVNVAGASSSGNRTINIKVSGSVSGLTKENNDKVASSIAGYFSGQPLAFDISRK